MKGEAWHLMHRTEPMKEGHVEAFDPFLHENLKEYVKSNNDIITRAKRGFSRKKKKSKFRV